MAVPQIVVRGFGSWGGVDRLPTLGFRTANRGVFIRHYHEAIGTSAEYRTIRGTAATYRELIGATEEYDTLTGISAEYRTTEGTTKQRRRLEGGK